MPYGAPVDLFYKILSMPTLLIVVEIEREKYGMIEVGKTLPRIERWEVIEATTTRLALEKGLSQDPKKYRYRLGHRSGPPFSFEFWSSTFVARMR